MTVNSSTLPVEIRGTPGRTSVEIRGAVGIAPVEIRGPVSIAPLEVYRTAIGRECRG